jgi:hypothetical protein
MSLRREHRQLQLLKEQIIQINLQLKMQLEIGLFQKEEEEECLTPLLSLLYEAI